MTGKDLLTRFESGEAAALWATLYGDEGVAAARPRYAALVEETLREADFPAAEFPETKGSGLRVFTAAGRTELGGNHTDHNQGKVLAASIQLDSVAIVAPREDMRVFFRSKGHGDVDIDLSELSPRESEKGTTNALVRGIAAEFVKRGTPVHGWTANAASLVLTGSGLSSSAACEVLIGRIFDSLYGDPAHPRSALLLAQIGQIAENVYFGKPCGLMDQTACASGGAVAIDFKDTEKPLVQRIDFDLAKAGYALCVVDTRGSHADLTPDYAAVPAEMKAVAVFFGKTVLRELDLDTVLARAKEIRAKLGDRALLRAIHFFNENERVDAERAAIEKMDLPALFRLVNESGDSSWELLQNVYSPRKCEAQGLSLALALTRRFLAGDGACRVHGGGFAGTIQAYIPLKRLPAYRDKMERVFGEGTVTPLRIRPIGAEELRF